MPKTKVTHQHKGPNYLERIKSFVKQNQDAYVTVGVHSNAGDYAGTDVSVAQVALWNEFGTPNAKHPTPERSFLRSAARDNKGDINKWFHEAIRQCILDGWTVEKALQMIGLRIQVLVQNKIKSNIAPENAPGTLEGMYGKPGKIELGQGTNTLIATGKLLQSITYFVYAPPPPPKKGDKGGHGE